MATYTYKQSQELYVLKRNATAPTPRRHSLVRRAAQAGLSTTAISEATLLSVRQVQRLLKGESH